MLGLRGLKGNESDSWNITENRGMSQLETEGDNIYILLSIFMPKGCDFQRDCRRTEIDEPLSILF
jgi:hypothetical protein